MECETEVLTRTHVLERPVFFSTWKNRKWIFHRQYWTIVSKNSCRIVVPYLSLWHMTIFPACVHRFSTMLERNLASLRMSVTVWTRAARYTHTMYVSKYYSLQWTRWAASWHSFAIPFSANGSTLVRKFHISRQNEYSSLWPEKCRLAGYLYTYKREAGTASWTKLVSCGPT